VYLLASVQETMQHVLLAQDNDPIKWGLLVFALLGTIVFLAIFAQFASLWLQCKMTRAGIGLLDLVSMRFRRVNPTVIVRSKIMTVQAGLTKKYPISTRALEAHYLAGGNVPNVIRADRRRKSRYPARLEHRTGHRSCGTRYSGSGEDERLSKGDRLSRIRNVRKALCQPSQRTVSNFAPARE
jgi:hypothetical protein